MSVTLTRTYEFVDNRHTQDAEQLLWDFADTISRTGVMIFRSQSAGIVFCPEHAQMLAGAGFSKTDVKDWLIEHCGRVEADLRRAGKDGVAESGHGVRSAAEAERVPGDTFSPFLPGRESVPIVVAGARNAAISMVFRVFGEWSNSSVAIEPSPARGGRRLGRRRRLMFSAEGLAGMRATLAADGYALDAREEDERVVVTITATPEACEDCLAPPDVMRAILGKSLAVPAEAIDLRYPRRGLVSSERFAADDLLTAEWMPGRTALVTGGGGREGGPGTVGWAVSRLLARHGARVAVLDRDPAAAARTVGQIEDAGGFAVAVVADVTRDEDCARAVAEARHALGSARHAGQQRRRLERRGALRRRARSVRRAGRSQSQDGVADDAATRSRSCPRAARSSTSPRWRRGAPARSTVWPRRPWRR